MTSAPKAYSDLPIIYGIRNLFAYLYTIDHKKWGGESKFRF